MTGMARSLEEWGQIESGWIPAQGPALLSSVNWAGHWTLVSCPPSGDHTKFTTHSLWGFHGNTGKTMGGKILCKCSVLELCILFYEGRNYWTGPSNNQQGFVAYWLFACPMLNPSCQQDPLSEKLLDSGSQTQFLSLYFHNTDRFWHHTWLLTWSEQSLLHQLIDCLLIQLISDTI